MRSRTLPARPHCRQDFTLPCYIARVDREFRLFRTRPPQAAAGDARRGAGQGRVRGETPLITELAVFPER